MLPPAPDFPPGLPWLNVKEPLSLEALRGKVVVLDFWTYGCVNCLHMAAELKTLEARFGDRLVVIGVHTPKFDNERNLETLRRNVLRYDLRHPVVQDEQGLMMEAYGAIAWPTLAVIDIEGRYLARFVGEGKSERLGMLVEQLLAMNPEAVNEEPLELALEQERASASGLAGPGNLAASGELVALSDSLHHRVVITDAQGRVQAVFGDGKAGLADGEAGEARFNAPQGLAIRGDRLYVADAGNHAVRIIDLASGRVSTLAGTGRIGLGRAPLTAADARETDLRSPWDLALDGEALYIAMAGRHQIWRLDLASGLIAPYAGTGQEGLDDGAAEAATFSQPSGLSVSGRDLVVADAEASAVRLVSLDDGSVTTLIGAGLFDFGDADGPLTGARLQHPSGVLALDDKSLLVTDTYNHKLKRIDPDRSQLSTVAGSGKPGAGDGGRFELNEPSGLARLGDQVLIADTNNDRILRFDPESGQISLWPLVWPDAP